MQVIGDKMPILSIRCALHLDNNSAGEGDTWFAGRKQGHEARGKKRRNQGGVGGVVVKSNLFQTPQ